MGLIGRMTGSMRNVFDLMIVNVIQEFLIFQSLFLLLLNNSSDKFRVIKSISE